MNDKKESIYDEPIENNFPIILDLIFSNTNINRNEKLVLINFLRIIENYEKDDYWFNFQIHEIMENCDLSRNDVTNALSSLVNKGFLDFKNEDQDKFYVYNCYKFTDKILDDRYGFLLIETLYLQERKNEIMEKEHFLYTQLNNEQQ